MNAKALAYKTKMIYTDNINIFTEHIDQYEKIIMLLKQPIL